MMNIFREKFFVLAALLFQLAGYAQIPKGYAGKPFRILFIRRGRRSFPGGLNWRIMIWVGRVWPIMTALLKMKGRN
jgi:hypothetical protein